MAEVKYEIPADSVEAMSPTESNHYELVVGIEVHAQVLTRSKMFCGCSADYASAAPNTHVCPVCMALPGSLPVINRVAIEHTIRAGLALNCEIQPVAVFARKNYNYPDLPKGYQISQYELPLCRNGWLEIEDDQGHPKRIGIRRVHLEEDTGKLTHVGEYSLVDLNRAGVPLMEIVSEADIRSPEEARRYLAKLRTILVYLGVNSGNMEEGAMRCEANASVRPVGSFEFGTKVEIKNLNSFRAVKMGLDYELARQSRLRSQGQAVQQVTMGWDDARNVTVVQRGKEEAHDYRYFPEPDLPPLVVKEAWVNEIRASLPELPDAKAKRFIAQYGINASDAGVLVDDRAVADYFEKAAEAYGEGRSVANWIAGELFRLLNASNKTIDDAPSPAALAGLLGLVRDNTINLNTAKKVLEEMFASSQSAAEIVKAHGLAQVSDTDALMVAVDAVIAANLKEVATYRSGKTGVFGWLMGQVMKSTGGKANTAKVKELLEARLKV